jgi:ApeA N-terminal domain 1
MAEFRVVGRWWDPNEPDAAIPGTLTIKDWGPVQLQTTGSLSQPVDRRVDEPQEYPRILGVTEDGEDVTLLDAIRTGWTSRNGEDGTQIIRETVIGQSAYLGAHLDDDPRFTQVVLSFEHLPEWASPREFDRPGEPMASNGGRQQPVRFYVPDPQPATNELGQLWLNFGWEERREIDQAKADGFRPDMR